jgi:uncharacterized protein involved in exopolysaccharide biosynthesis
MNESTVRQTQNGTTSHPSLRDMVSPLFRHKRLVVLTFLGVLAGSVIAAIVMAYLYQVDFEILVNRTRLDPLVTTEQTNQPSLPTLPPTEEEINSEVELLQSRDLLQRVVLANGLQIKEKNSWAGKLLPKLTEAEYVDKASRRLGDKLKITAVEKTNDITVSYRALEDPQFVYGVMNSLATFYMEKHLAVNRASGSLDFFTSETEKYRKALADSETKLAAFGVDAGVAAPDVVRSYMAQELATFEGALDQARQGTVSDQERVKEVQSQMATTTPRSPTQSVTSPPIYLLQALGSNLLAAQLKRTQLLLKYDPSYPLVREADEEVAAAQGAISEANKTQYLDETTDRDPTYELLREDIARTNADLATQSSTAGAVQHSIKTIKEQLVDLDQKAIKQSDLIREAKADEANYLLYLSKREQARTLDALDRDRVANVSIASPPMMPALPAFSPMLVFGIGFFLAMFLSIGGAFVADYLDTSFRTPSEVTDILSVPVLASVPRRAA